MESNMGKWLVLGAIVVVFALFTPLFIYNECRINVPSYHMAVLIKKTGKNIPNNAEIAPDASYKGVQQEVLGEGRYYYNPWNGIGWSCRRSKFRKVSWVFWFVCTATSPQTAA